MFAAYSSMVLLAAARHDKANHLTARWRSIRHAVVTRHEVRSGPDQRS